MKKIYIKPEVAEVKMSASAVMAGSWTVDGKKDPSTGDGGDIIEGNPDAIDSRKNESGWNFDW